MKETSAQRELEITKKPYNNAKNRGDYQGGQGLPEPDGCHPKSDAPDGQSSCARTPPTLLLPALELARCLCHTMGLGPVPVMVRVAGPRDTKPGPWVRGAAAGCPPWEGRVGVVGSQTQCPGREG